jgi:hypothetical protein
MWSLFSIAAAPATAALPPLLLLLLLVKELLLRELQVFLRIVVDDSRSMLAAEHGFPTGRGSNGRIGRTVTAATALRRSGCRE